MPTVEQLEGKSLGGDTAYYNPAMPGRPTARQDGGTKVTDEETPIGPLPEDGRFGGKEGAPADIDPPTAPLYVGQEFTKSDWDSSR